MSSNSEPMPRRRLLALAAAAAAAGCTSDQQRVLPSPSASGGGPPTSPDGRPTATGSAATSSAPPPAATTTAPPPPDPQLAQLRTELDLVAAYDAAAREHPDRAATLAGIRADHAAHVTALRTAIGPSAAAVTATPAPAASAPASPPAANASGTPSQSLPAAEEAAAASYVKAAMSAAPARAALLGSIAASERAHLSLLDAPPAFVTVPAPAASAAADLRPLQETLAAEDAVVWGYDVVGGQSSDELRPQVRVAQRRHADLRHLLASAVATKGATPTPPAAGYQLPFAVDGPAAALRLAIHLEDGAGASWHHLVGNASASVRRTALAALGNCAVQSTLWREQAHQPAHLAFPGR